MQSAEENGKQLKREKKDADFGVTFLLLSGVRQGSYGCICRLYNFIVCVRHTAVKITQYAIVCMFRVQINETRPYEKERTIETNDVLSTQLTLSMRHSCSLIDFYMFLRLSSRKSFIKDEMLFDVELGSASLLIISTLLHSEFKCVRRSETAQNS